MPLDDKMCPRHQVHARQFLRRQRRRGELWVSPALLADRDSAEPARELLLWSTLYANVS